VLWRALILQELNLQILLPVNMLITFCNCENDNEFSGSIKGGKFLEYLSGCWLLKDFVPWS
jgi:hypothetical protein